jgi:hypothetical protein
VSRPALVVVVELEGVPRVLLAADSWEDERRLRVWLASPGLLEELAELLEALDVLHEEEAAT